MRAVDIIRKKRDGEALSPAEIAAMVSGSASGEVADYQWAALLMAIFWRGMNETETAALTDAMIRSGPRHRSFAHSRAQDRQAQHRRGRRQDLAHSCSGRRRRRSTRADGLGPRPGTYRRNARQAGIDPRFSRRPRPGSVPGRSSPDAVW